VPDGPQGLPAFGGEEANAKDRNDFASNLKRSAPRTKCSSIGAIDVERGASLAFCGLPEGVILYSEFCLPTPFVCLRDFQ
jgi:hypothetical protein